MPPCLVRLLPPVSFTGDDGLVTLHPARARALLAALALQPGHVVTLTKLVQVLWDDPPATARANIRTLVAKVRAGAVSAGLGDEVQVVTHRAAWAGEGGYSMEVDPANVDLLALDHRLRTVRRLAFEDPAAALAECREVLALDLEAFGVDFLATHWFETVRTALENTRRSLRRFSVALRILGGSYQEAHEEARAGAGDDPQLAEFAVTASFLVGDALASIDGVQHLLRRHRDYGLDLPATTRRLQSSILDDDAEGVVAVVREALARL